MVRRPMVAATSTTVELHRKVNGPSARRVGA